MLWRGKSRNFEDILSAFLNYSSNSKTDVESNINLTFPNFHLIMLDVNKEYDHSGGADKVVEQAIDLGCQVRKYISIFIRIIESVGGFWPEFQYCYITFINSVKLV